MGKINVDDYLSSHQWMKGLVPLFIKDIDMWGSDDPAEKGSETDLHRANVLTSKSNHSTNDNRLLLDIDDSDVYIEPSSTTGHYHIAFPNTINDEDYATLVTLLHKVGIIKEGNFKSWKKLGYLALRAPWVKKGHTAAMYKEGKIGPGPEFRTDDEALKELQKACSHLGVEFPNEIYQQLNAKLVAAEVDIPDAPPVDW